LASPTAGAATVFGLAVLYFQSQSGRETGVKASVFDNPLDLSFVLRFGVLLSVITVGANIANRNLGAGGVIGLAGISGFVDVDPITLSVSRLAGVSITADQAADAILLAAIANMVTKMSATVAIGGWRFGVPLAAAGVAAIAVGTASWFFIGV